MSCLGHYVQSIIPVKKTPHHPDNLTPRNFKDRDKQVRVNRSKQKSGHAGSSGNADESSGLARGQISRSRRGGAGGLLVLGARRGGCHANSRRGNASAANSGYPRREDLNRARGRSGREGRSHRRLNGHSDCASRLRRGGGSPLSRVGATRGFADDHSIAGAKVPAKFLSGGRILGVLSADLVGAIPNAVREVLLRAETGEVIGGTIKLGVLAHHVCNAHLTTLGQSRDIHILGSAHASQEGDGGNLELHLVECVLWWRLMSGDGLTKMCDILGGIEGVLRTRSEFGVWECVRMYMYARAVEDERRKAQRSFA